MNEMNRIYDSFTFRLFKGMERSPLLEGTSSLVDFGVSPMSDEYHLDATGIDADANSIRADWKQVGEDLRQAMRHYASRQTA